MSKIETSVLDCKLKYPSEGLHVDAAFGIDTFEKFILISAPDESFDSYHILYVNLDLSEKERLFQILDEDLHSST